jgi:hypothetical protein
MTNEELLRRTFLTIVELMSYITTASGAEPPPEVVRDVTLIFKKYMLGDGNEA